MIRYFQNHSQWFKIRFERVMRHEWIRGSTISATILFIFFARVILKGLVLGDFDQIHEWPPFSPSKLGTWNPLLSDQVLSYLPWALYARGQMRHFSIPFWNPYANLGTPLIANDQTAVFFPINLVSYALPLTVALDLVPFLKLLVAGTSTYCLARKYRLSVASATISASAFMLCGFNVVWLGYAHSNVAILLPAMIYFAEELVEGSIAKVAPLAVIVFLQSLGGQAEMQVIETSGVALYLILRGFTAIRPISLVRRIRLVFRSEILLMAALVLGIALSSVQVIPFVEYMLANGFLSGRGALGANPYLIDPHYAIALVLPDYFGNPILHYYWGGGPNINYNEVNGAFVGVPALLLAVAAIFTIRKNEYARAFLGLGIVSFLIVYGVQPIFGIVTLIPILSVTALHRSLLILALSLSMLAGFGCEAVFGSNSSKAKPRLVYVAAFVLIAFVAVAVVLKPFPATKLSILFETVVILLFFLFTILTLLFVTLSRIRPKLPFISWKTVMVVLVLVNLFQFGMFYNTAVKPAEIYPSNPALDFLKRDASAFRVLSLGWVFPPNLGTAYQLSDARGYDALYPRLGEGLKKSAGIGDVFPWLQITQNAYMSNLIDLMNIKYLMIAQNSPPSDPNLVVDISQSNNTRPIGELVEGMVVDQSFISRQANLTAISILFATYARSNSGTTIVHFRPAGYVIDIANLTLRNQELNDNSYVTLSFPQLADSKGKAYSIIIESKGTYTGNAVTVWSTPSSAPGGTLRINGYTRPGSICFTTYSRVRGRYHLVYQDSKVRIFENTHVYPRAFLVHTVLKSNHVLEDLVAADERGIDLRNIAIVDPDVAMVKSLNVTSPERAKDMVTITNYQPEQIDIDVSTTSDALLIVTNVFYPGWSAFVDGTPSPVLKVDYAFQGIALSAGSHHVHLAYMPRFGNVILIVTGIGMLVTVLLYTDIPSRSRQKLPRR